MKLTSSRAEDRVRAEYAQSTARDVLDQSPAMEWVLSLLGFVLLLIGLARRSRAGLTLTLIGGALVYGPARKRVNSALRDTLESRHPKAIVVDRAVTILRSRNELYADWHEFQSLPRIVPILKTVTPTGERRSHWVAEGPRGQTLEWDVEITYDYPNELIRWQALPGAPIPNRAKSASIRRRPTVAPRSGCASSLMRRSPLLTCCSVPARATCYARARVISSGSWRLVRSRRTILSRWAHV